MRQRQLPFSAVVSRTIASCISFCITVVATSAADAQLNFQEVAQSSGFESYQGSHGMGAGVAAADFDNDGDIDLFVPTGGGVRSQLYRNTGTGGFEEISASVGINSFDRDRAAIWFDYDGDHQLDLLIVGDCYDRSNFVQCQQDTTLKLFRQVSVGSFVDATTISGLTRHLVADSDEHVGGLSAGDLNGDDYLDVFIAFWNTGPSWLLLSQNGQSFDLLNFSDATHSQGEHNWQPIILDFNDDGFQDIFTAIDAGPNHLWINDGTGQFTDLAPQFGVNSAWNDMGVAIGDYDNDRDFDIHISEITFGNGSPRHNVLYRNDSGAGYNEVAETHNVDNGGWAWGTTFLDCDNDRDLDLAVTNGYYDPPWSTDTTRLFLNDGSDSIVFQDVASAANMADQLWGSSLIAFDYDRDGDLDLTQTCANAGPIRLLQNQLTESQQSGGWLVVRPRQPGPNHFAIGATVRVRIGSEWMARPILAGTSLMGQEPAEAFFGLGDASIVDQVSVEWPGSGTTSMYDVATNQTMTMTPADGIPAASEWGLLILSLLLSCAGTRVFRQRNVTPTPATPYSPRYS